MAGFARLAGGGTPPRASASAVATSGTIAPVVSKQGYLYSALPRGGFARHYYALRSGRLFVFEHVEVDSWPVAELSASLSNDEGPMYKDSDYGETIAYPNTFALVARGKATLQLACQNPATRTSWITALATSDDTRGCIGYLLTARGRGKWAKMFFSFLNGKFSSYNSRLVTVHELGGGASGMAAVLGAAGTSSIECSVSLNSVQTRVRDPSSGKELECCSISLLEGTRLTRLFVRAPKAASEWVSGIRSAVSRNRYLTLVGDPNSRPMPLVGGSAAVGSACGLGVPSALSGATVGPASEDEVIVAVRALRAGTLADQRAAAWALAVLSCETANRELMMLPDTGFVPALCAAAASPDEELSLEAFRAMCNLATNPRAHAEIVHSRALDVLCVSGLGSPYLATLEAALTLLKTMIVYRGLPESDVARFVARLDEVKTRTREGALAPARPAVKELQRVLEKIVARDAAAAMAANENAPPMTPTRARAAASPAKSLAARVASPRPQGLDDSFERFVSARASAAAAIAAAPARTVAPDAPTAAAFAWGLEFDAGPAKPATQLSRNPFASPARFSLI